MGNLATLIELAKETGWEVVFAPRNQASPVVGYLRGKDDLGNELLVEVLFTVVGLDARDLKNVVDLPLGGKFYRTLSPVSLLKAKIANVCNLPQQTPTGLRNDLKHVKMLIPCVTQYLSQALAKVTQGKFTERSFINLMEETLTIVNTSQAQGLAEREQIDFLRCFPKELTESQLEKVRNFCHYRLAKHPQK